MDDLPSPMQCRQDSQGDADTIVVIRKEMGPLTIDKGLVLPSYLGSLMKLSFLLVADLGRSADVVLLMVTVSGV